MRDEIPVPELTLESLEASGRSWRRSISSHSNRASFSKHNTTVQTFSIQNGSINYPDRSYSRSPERTVIQPSKYQSPERARDNSSQLGGSPDKRVGWNEHGQVYTSLQSAANASALNFTDTTDMLTMPLREASLEYTVLT